MNTELSDYWMHFISEYGRNSVHIAPRFYDIAPNDWLRLTSVYYSRFGMKHPPKDDAYIGKLPGTDRDVMRSHRADAIVLENPAMDDMAKFFYDTWLAKKAALEKNRNKEPDTVILPPPQEPPMWEPEPKPEPKPVELPPKKEEPKKQRPEWQIKTGVWLTVLTPIAALGTMMLPPPWNIVGKALFEALKLLIGG
jgi:hypothetical protein